VSDHAPEVTPALIEYLKSRVLRSRRHVEALRSEMRVAVLNYRGAVLARNSAKIGVSQ
jgi:hypothetical protein